VEPQQSDAANVNRAPGLRLRARSFARALVCVVGASAIVISLSAFATTPHTPNPPVARARPLVQNHTLTPGNCGPARGRQSWHIGTVQCNLDDSGAIVAVYQGKAAVTYSGTPVQREIHYVDANWYTQGTTNYTYIPNEDCANFVSQALHARGWAYTKAWKPNTIDWVSSTHLRAWILSAYPGVTELKGIASFSQVKVGDIAQFDWKNTGIRNHTAIVTAVRRMPDGTYQVWVGEHTDPYEYRNVEQMVTVTHPGATVYFLSLGSS
jgi:hypothetical protein